MRLFLCLLFLSWELSHCLPVENLDLDAEWEQWKLTFGKNYAKEEESLRRQIWDTNMKLINDHNAMYQEGKHTYKMKMNFFGDMTEDEYRKVTYTPAPVRERRSIFPEYTGDLPKSVDWREKGFLNPVRQQGTCGSCWTFAVTGALEGQIFLKTGKLVELSKQQLLDCSGLPGCEGANPISAFRHIMRYNRLDTEECYPYEGQDGLSCRFDPDCSIPINMTDYVTLPAGDEESLMRAVATVGPVNVAICVQPTLRFYTSGIYNDPYCSRVNLDHAVLVVGYGYEESEDEDEEETSYWIVKNSWGVNWGEEGYIRIAKDNNICGIASDAMYPVL